MAVPPPPPLTPVLAERPPKAAPVPVKAGLVMPPGLVVPSSASPVSSVATDQGSNKDAKGVAVVSSSTGLESSSAAGDTKGHVRGGGTLVSCDSCGTEDGWKRMKSTKQWQSDAEDDWRWVRTCVNCLAVERGISVQLAQAAIVEEAPCYVARRERAAKFRHAMENVQEQFPGLGSGRKVYQVAREEFKHILEGLATAIRRKREHQWLLDAQSKRFAELVQEMKVTTEPGRARAILKELDGVYDEEYLAFADKGKAEQWRYLSAASYSDEWSTNGDTWFRMWYICLAHNPRCLTMLLSKSWGRKFSDPLATGQAWYCKCAARFRAKWGVVLEVRCRDGENVLFKAECPDWHKEDIRAMAYEERYRPNSPEELYSKVPVAAPTTSDLVQAVDVAAGVYRMRDDDAYKALATLPWGQFFNMA